MLAQALADCSSSRRVVRLVGASSKDSMGGPLPTESVSISTTALASVLNYEPRDLTISVGAGMRWRDLSLLLRDNQQMIPLDPPYLEQATVGGVVAANTTGYRRRLYGSVRDVVIGMEFATVEGKLVQSGGMVVKNVAGLDMGKLMIGSFGTLAAITRVNFKLAPMPSVARTFLLQYETLEEAIVARNELLKGVLQPAAIDLLNPAAAARVGLDGHCLLLQIGGSEVVVARYERSLPGSRIVDEAIWVRIREFGPEFLQEFSQGAVLRISTTLEQMRDVFRRYADPIVARAGSGVSYVHLVDAAAAQLHGFKGAVESASQQSKGKLDLWPSPGSDFPLMKRIKHMFDPQNLLNPGRLYGRI
jgi:glycolate oxidase FAD binding subunit